MVLLDFFLGTGIGVGIARRVPTQPWRLQMALTSVE